MLLRAWRRFPWPGGRGRDRAKVLLTRDVRPPRAVPTNAGWLLLEQGPDSLERHILATGTHWETQVVALLRANRGTLRGTVAVDVGGHVGFYALLLADLVGSDGRVVAVEAHGALCDRIDWAAAKNGRPWLEVVHGAASDIRSPVVLNADPDRGHTTTAPVDGETFTVDGLVLDDELVGRPPQLVLMDIEGGEWRALHGLARTLAEHGPDLVVEVHPEQLLSLGTSQEALIDWLRGIGDYELAVIDHHTGIHPLVEAPVASSWHLLARHRTRGLLEIPLSP